MKNAKKDMCTFLKVRIVGDMHSIVKHESDCETMTHMIIGSECWMTFSKTTEKAHLVMKKNQLSTEKKEVHWIMDVCHECGKSIVIEVEGVESNDKHV